MGRWSKGWRGNSHITTIVMLVITVMLGFVSVAFSQSKEQVIKVQRMLGALGYDPGSADGEIGPKTRQAIETFQRSYNIPISRRIDHITLNTLGFSLPELEQPLARSETGTETPEPILVTPSVPWRAVLSYLRYFDTQPARLLPYVTQRFREGMPPHAWIQHMATTLANQKFSRLSWQIESVAPNAMDIGYQATIQVHSRVRIAGEELTRRETFTVVRADNTQWLIDEWRSNIIPTTDN